MSLALIKAWSIGMQVPHTAIDDLESFIWVSLWSVLSILESKNALENLKERSYLNTMRTDDLFKLRNRSEILEDLQGQQEVGEFSKGLEPFGPLLIQWLQIAKPVARKVGRFLSDVVTLETFLCGVYEEYINAGFEHLVNLPENWDYLNLK